MSKSVINLLPEPPAGSKWRVTVLDSTTMVLGVKLFRMKPYREFGGAVINEHWSPAKVAAKVAWIVEEADTGRAAA